MELASEAYPKQGKNGDDEVLLELRERSRRIMQATFAGLAILALAAGLAVRHYAPGLGLAEDDPAAIADCFLCMAISYAATIFIWEWLFDPDA